MLIILAMLFWFGYRPPLTAVPFWQDPWTNLQVVIGPARAWDGDRPPICMRAWRRSSLLEVIREDYIRTARAKGLNRRLVVGLHALPNAMLPVITLSGISARLRARGLDPGRAAPSPRPASAIRDVPSAVSASVTCS